MRITTRISGRLCLGVSLVSFTASGGLLGPAMAQGGPADSEIVTVTAQRRAQDLQEVPSAVTAFTSTLRDETGIITAQDQLNFTPGVTYNPGQDRVTIRGIGRLTTNLGTDQGVAVYSDGIYVGSAAGIGGSTLGTARVEVLRGPQGTLYGRNSVGGAVNTISRRPDDEFAFDLRSSVNSYGGIRAESRVSQPIAEGVALSLMVSAVDQEHGYYENTAGGPDEGGVESSWTADFQIEAEFDDFDAWVRYSTLESETKPRNSTGITPYGEPARGEGVPYVFYGLPAELAPGVKDHRKFFSDIPTITELDDYHFLVGELVWHGDGFDVKYLGGYRTYDSYTSFDGNATANKDFRFPYDCYSLQAAVINSFLPANSPLRMPPAERVLAPGTTREQFKQNLDLIEDCDLTQPGTQRRYQDVHNDTFDDITDVREEMSHEINITSTGDGPLQYIVGAYYFHADQEQDFRIVALNEPGNNAITVPGTSLPNPSPNESNIYRYKSDLETTSKAIFGQIDYQFTEELKATIGLRYSKDEKVGYEENIYNYWLVWGWPVGFTPFGIDIDGPGPIGQSFVPNDLIGGACWPNGVDAEPPEGVPPFRRLDPNQSCPIARDVEGSYEAVTGTAGLEWTPSEDRLVYIKYSRGFKSGGFNLGWVLEDPFVDSEFLDAFEVGWKETIDDTLQFNSAFFFYKYQDQQATNSRIQGTIVLTELINLPEVESYGAELEVTWEPIDNLRILANYSYLHTEITEDNCNENTPIPWQFCLGDGTDPYAVQPGAKPAGPLVVGATRDQQRQTLVGNKLAGSPEHKVAINATYVWQFDVGELIASATWNWIDESYQTLFNVPLHVIEGGDSTDIRLTWNDADSGVSIIGTIENVFDQEVVNGFQTLTPQNLSFQSIYLEPPRIYTLEVRYSF